MYGVFRHGCVPLATEGDERYCILVETSLSLSFSLSQVVDFKCVFSSRLKQSARSYFVFHCFDGMLAENVAFVCTHLSSVWVALRTCVAFTCSSSEFFFPPPAPPSRTTSLPAFEPQLSRKLGMLIVLLLRRSVRESSVISLKSNYRPLYQPFHFLPCMTISRRLLRRPSQLLLLARRQAALNGLT